MEHFFLKLRIIETACSMKYSESQKIHPSIHPYNPSIQSSDTDTCITTFCYNYTFKVDLKLKTAPLAEMYPQVYEYACIFHCRL